MATPFPSTNLTLSQICIAYGGIPTPYTMSALKGRNYYSVTGTQYTVPTSGSFNLGDYRGKILASAPSGPTNFAATSNYQISRSLTAPNGTFIQLQVSQVGIVLTWNEPNSGGAPIDYYMLYSTNAYIFTVGPSPFFQLSQLIITDGINIGNVNTYAFYNLRANTTYDFVIKAHNIVGLSSPVSVSITTVPLQTACITTDAVNLSIDFLGRASNDPGYSLNGTGSYIYILFGNYAPFYLCIENHSGSGAGTNYNVRINGVTGNFNIPTQNGVNIYFPNGIAANITDANRNNYVNQYDNVISYGVAIGLSPIRFSGFTIRNVTWTYSNNTYT